MFNIVKFLSGFALWKGEVIGKILYIVIIVAVCFGIFYAIFLKRTVSNITHQSGTITNISQEDKRKLEFFIGGYGDVYGDGDTIGVFGGIKF